MAFDSEEDFLEFYNNQLVKDNKVTNETTDYTYKVADTYGPLPINKPRRKITKAQSRMILSGLTVAMELTDKKISKTINNYGASCTVKASRT